MQFIVWRIQSTLLLKPMQLLSAWTGSTLDSAGADNFRGIMLQASSRHHAITLTEQRGSILKKLTNECRESASLGGQAGGLKLTIL